MEAHQSRADAEFSPAERDAVYKCIFNRRDVRGQFLPQPIPDAVLARILLAAHHAPSVGFMQPWDFIVIRDAATKGKVRDAFEAAHQEAAGMFADDRQQATNHAGVYEDVDEEGQSQTAGDQAGKCILSLCR